MGTGEETAPKVGMNDANDLYLDDFESGVVGLTAGYSPLKEWSMTCSVCEMNWLTKFEWFTMMLLR